MQRGRGDPSRPLQALSPGVSQSPTQGQPGMRRAPRPPRDPHSFFLLGWQRHKVGRGVSSPETYQRSGCPGEPAPEPETQGLARAQAPELTASRQLLCPPAGAQPHLRPGNTSAQQFIVTRPPLLPTKAPESRYSR